MSSAESKDNGDAVMKDESQQQQQQQAEQQNEGGAAAAPSTGAAAAAAAPAAAAAAGDSADSGAAAPAPAASTGSSSTKKGKSKGKKEEALEADPNYEGQRFKVGELIFANYAEGKQWFEAKVLKVEKRKDTIYYYLHYQGWSDKYHDWRPYHHDSELHKHDEAGKRLMEEAKQRMREGKKAGGKGGAAAAAPSTDDVKSGKKGKRKLGDDDDTVSDEVSVGGSGANEVRLRIPGYLKKQLIADWEAVTRNHRLVTLPRPLSVKALLKEFEDSKQKQESSHLMVKEICSGLQQYFEKALGTVLLYRFERPQLKAQQALLEGQPGKTLGDVYGAEHLLRLFVKLPGLLAYTKLEAREAIVLGSKLNDFIKWLDKKAQGGALFQAEYEATEQEYMQTVLTEGDA